MLLYHSNIKNHSRPLFTNFTANEMVHKQKEATRNDTSDKTFLESNTEDALPDGMQREHRRSQQTIQLLRNRHAGTARLRPRAANVDGQHKTSSQRHHVMDGRAQRHDNTGLRLHTQYHTESLTTRLVSRQWLSHCNTTTTTHQ